MTHVATSVGLMGSVAAFLLLAILGIASPDPGMAHSVYPAMDLLTRFLILPLVLTSLGIGTVQALVTPCGLFRHWWVVMKFLLNLFVLVVLLVQLPGIQRVAEAVISDASLTGLTEVRLSFVFHAAGGLATLTLPLILSVYKPPGLTGYGRRKTARP